MSFYLPCSTLNLHVVWSLPRNAPAFLYQGSSTEGPALNGPHPWFNALLLSEVLNVVSELVFCKWSLMQYVPTVPHQPTQSLRDVCMHKIPADPWCRSWEEMQSKYKQVIPTTKWGPESPKRPHYLNQTLIWTQKGNSILSSMNDHGTLSYPFLLMLLFFKVFVLMSLAIYSLH